MTVNALLKALTRLRDSGHGRSTVSVSKTSFQHPLESDGATILRVEAVRPFWIAELDGDGCQIENKDWSERGRWNVVMFGDADDLQPIVPTQEQP